MIALYGSISFVLYLVLLQDRIKSSVRSRTVLFVSNVILVVLAARIYYFYIVMNGSVSKVVCQSSDSTNMYETVDFMVKCENRT